MPISTIDSFSRRFRLIVLIFLALRGTLAARAQEPGFYPGGVHAVRFEQHSGYFHYVVPCRLLVRAKYWTGLVAGETGERALCWPVNVIQLHKVTATKAEASPPLAGMLQISATQLQFLPMQAKHSAYYLLAPAASAGVEHKPNTDMAFFFTRELGYRFGFTNFCLGCVADSPPIDESKTAQCDEEYSLVSQSLQQFDSVYNHIREKAAFLRIAVTPGNQPIAKDIPEAMSLYGGLNQRLAEMCPEAANVCIRRYASYQTCIASQQTAGCGEPPSCSSQCTVSASGVKDLKANVCITEREDTATLTPDWSEVLKRRDGDLPPGPRVFEVHEGGPNASPVPTTGVMGGIGMGMQGGRSFYDGTAGGGTLSLADCSAAHSYNLARSVYNQAAHPSVLKGLAMLDDKTVMANIVHRVSPVYPPVAKAARITGSVWLATVIGKDGEVSRISALSGPEMLRGAAIDAVSQWKFKPYLQDGTAVAVSTTLVVIFAFEQSP